ncbi:MAG: type II pantothenate kinase [Ruminococcaceae bacterium]|nr:type II pantothenate kinase [Oscillospiraceae bacterium]
MGVVIGIDIGGSTTKIVGFDQNKNLIEPMFVTADDPITSVYGAFGKFTDTNGLGLNDIEKVMITGVGSSYISKPLYGLECVHTPEFKSIGLGGLYLSSFDDAIIVSLGTGTALVHAKRGKAPEYLGGTGVGGGTLVGLSSKFLGLTKIESIDELAKVGSIENIDLRICDISKKDMGLSSHMTASNFGKISDTATNGDLALGLINMVFETIGMISYFASKQYGIKDIVLTGNLTQISQASEIFDNLNKMFNMNFVIPEKAQYSTVIGAALSSFEK